MSDLRRRRRGRQRRAKRKRSNLVFIVAGCIAAADRRRRPGLGAGGPLGRREPPGREPQGDPPRAEHADLRQGRQAARDRRGRDQPHRGPVGAHPAGPQGRDRRDRGQALLRARRRRLLPPARAPPCATSRAAPPRQGGSTITMQLIKNLYDPKAEPDALEEDRGGVPRLPVREEVHEGRDPREVPERGLLRPERRRRAGRLAHLLRHGRVEDQPDPGRPAGRPAPGAEQLQPVRRPRGRPRAPQRRARPDGRPGLHHPGEGRAGQALGHRPEAGQGLQGASARSTSSSTSARS